MLHTFVGNNFIKAVDNYNFLITITLHYHADRVWIKCSNQTGTLEACSVKLFDLRVSLTRGCVERISLIDIRSAVSRCLLYFDDDTDSFGVISPVEKLHRKQSIDIGDGTVGRSRNSHANRTRADYFLHRRFQPNDFSIGEEKPLKHLQWPVSIL